MTRHAEITRHDFSRTHRGVLNAAVRLKIVDAIELGCLVHNHGTDVETLLAEITDAAEALLHCQGDVRSAWLSIVEAVRYFENANPEDSDRFGFKAEARSQAAGVLLKHGIEIPSREEPRFRILDEDGSVLSKECTLDELLEDNLGIWTAKDFDLPVGGSFTDGGGASPLVRIERIK